MSALPKVRDFAQADAGDPEFRETRFQEKGRLAFARCAEEGGIVLMIGPIGSGKTTLKDSLLEGYAASAGVDLNEWIAAPSSTLLAIRDALIAKFSDESFADFFGVDVSSLPFSGSHSRPMGSSYIQTLRLFGELREVTGERPMLLIDNGEIARTKTLNALRFFSDHDLCGLVVFANPRLRDPETGRFDPGLEPLLSRAKWRIEQRELSRADIAIVLDGHGIADPASRELLTGIAQASGIRGLTYVVRGAQEISGAPSPTLDDLKAAAAIYAAERVEPAPARGRRGR